MQNLKSLVNVHPKDQEKTKAEILSFHLAYVSLGTEIFKSGYFFVGAVRL